MNWKELVGGCVLIFILGIAGFLYRAALEHPSASNVLAVCTQEAKICPDGSAVGRTGTTCTFAPCPPPNITLASAGIVFALPSGYSATTSPDGDTLAAYAEPIAGASDEQEIVIRQYPIPSGVSAEDVIHATALGASSGAVISPSAFSSATFAERTYSVAPIERFEGVVDTAYYLVNGTNVLRFDAIDRDVANWSDPSLDSATLPAATDLRALLTNIQTNQ